MRIVAALGGNALLERGEKPDALIQRHHVQRAAAALAPLTRDHQLVITHGNGPQIGLLAIESESDPALSQPYPLDALGAQTQGMIGYWLTQELRNEKVATEVVGVLTQTVVDGGDPAFAAPTKFVGATYDEALAKRLAAERDWTVAPDGARWRRVVPSPAPQSVVEIATIEQLVAAGVTVVCGGGGGAPVVVDGSGRLTGVSAVVDKDLTAGLMARLLGADLLLLLTDVAGVFTDFGTARARLCREIDASRADVADFPAGSMGPKVEACVDFVLRTGRQAAIGALTDAAAIVGSRAGTSVIAK